MLYSNIPPRLNYAWNPPLVGGKLVPQPHGLGVVLRDPSAIVVHPPEVALHHRRVPVGKSSDQPQEPRDVDVGRAGKRDAAGRELSIRPIVSATMFSPQ